MGNTNPVAMVAGKNAASQKMDEAQDGLKSLTAGKTEEQLQQEARAKDRVAEYEQKKKERAERKAKLSQQWAANKKGWQNGQQHVWWLSTVMQGKFYFPCLAEIKSIKRSE